MNLDYGDARQSALDCKSKSSQTRIEENDGLAAVRVDVCWPVFMFLPAKFTPEKTERHGKLMVDFYYFPFDFFAFFLFCLSMEWKQNENGRA